MRSAYPVFLGFCQDSSVPKYVYRVSLDEIGTSDSLDVENATLKGSDRDMLLSALSSRVNNERLRIADKYNDLYVPNSKEPGTFTVSKYQFEPNNQVVDFTYGFDLSRNDDYNEALRALRPRLRLAAFKAWLSPAADEESQQQHISRVAELARLQNERHRCFLVISEPISGREEESNSILEENSRV